MAKIDPNLLIDQEWTGIFFPPGLEDLAFAGRLKYSPTNGLRLEFARLMSKADRDLKWTYLFGQTSTGEPLTLVGEFSARNSGCRVMNGMGYWTSTAYPFRYAIFGCHIEDTVTFDTFEFDITGAQEFFVPDVEKEGVPFSNTAVVTTQCGVGKVSVIHSGRFNLASTDLRVHFHSDNEDALDELQQSYTEIRARHPEFQPYLKKQLDFLFRFIPTKKLTIPDAVNIITSIADLFAMLFFGPAKLIYLKTFVRDEKGRPCPMVVIPSTLNDKATIERSQAKKNHHNLPLNNGDVNLGVLLSKWLTRSDRYLTIVSALQSKVSVISNHQIHGDIVLAATQLEGIAKEAGKNADKVKFQYGIDNHASEKLQTHLSRLLDCAPKDIGKKISDLRNDIAHVGRSKTLLNKLSQRQQLNLSVALQVVVIGYALEQIELSTQARDKYQDTVIWR